ASESADTSFRWIEDVKAEEFLLELRELWFGDDDIWRDAAAAGHLTAGVGELDLRRVIGDLALVVILVERNRLVVALNEAAAGRVVASSRQGKAGVFAERLNGLHEALAESGFAYNQATIVILHGAGDDFCGGGGIVVDEDD